MEQVQQKATKMIKGLELPSYKGETESCACSALVKRKLGGTHAYVQTE